MTLRDNEGHYYKKREENVLHVYITRMDKTAIINSLPKDHLEDEAFIDSFPKREYKEVLSEEFENALQRAKKILGI